MWFKSVAPTALLSAVLITGCSTPAAAPVEPAAEVPAAVAVETAAVEATPEPSVPMPADTVPDGTWAYSDVLTEVGGAAKSWWSPVPKEGDKATGDPWEFSSTCTDDLCTGKITRASDKGDEDLARDFTWDGKNLVITRPTQKATDKCYTDDKPNGHKWSWQRKWVYDPVEVKLDDSGKAKEINVTITGTVKDTTKSDRNCGDALKPAHEVFAAVLIPA